MKKRLVIYHGHCIDGWTSAWAAWRAYGDEDTEYMPASYGDVAPYVAGKEVLIVDFSYPLADLQSMFPRSGGMRVLDHHKTAQADLGLLPFATFDMNRSGAGITWDVLHPGMPRPWLIDYVEDRDLWRFSLPNSKNVNAWIGACKRDSFQEWDVLSATGAAKAGEMGAAVNAFIERYVHEMTAQARLVDFAGHKVPIVNAPYICISELLGKLAETAPFSLGWSQRADGLFAYSLRSRGSDGVDVSEIAMRYGGGGHKHSAGFVADTPYHYALVRKQ
jgi:hypothetical protein